MEIKVPWILNYFDKVCSQATKKEKKVRKKKEQKWLNNNALETDRQNTYRLV